MEGFNMWREAIRLSDLFYISRADMEKLTY